MKRITALALAFFMVLLIPAKEAKAQIGDLGFFGGITEGRKLPKTTELILAESAKKDQTQEVEMIYKEVIFVSGTPTEYEGLLSVKASGVPDKEKGAGTYTVTYTVKNSDTSPAGITVDRNITFNVNYRYVDNQIIKDYSAKTWTESITVPEGTFSLDKRQSYFDVSFLEDHTPGVKYYKGNISQRSVYTGGESGKTTLETSGDVYGYSSAWSATETHRINGIVSNDDFQIQYQVRPSVGVNKTTQYQETEPTAISFNGNYREVNKNISGLTYDIFKKPTSLSEVPDEGKSTINTYNTFEQLIAPDLEFLKGHFAEYDIKKLFAMQVFEGPPSFFVPNQAITRGDYVEALTKAIKLPIEKEEKKKSNKKKQDTVNIFLPDVTDEMPEYPYIKAAYESGLAIGRSNGYFYKDSSLEREEAVVILLRAIGLENLGLDPTPITAFTDDASIANWAKREIYAAQRIGLISGDSEGKLNPKEKITKAEAAALINRLIEYMRTDMQTDYTENIVNYSN